MNQEQRRKLYEKGFNDGVESTQDYMVKALYGAAALAAHREFGFGSTRCQRLLNKMDQIVTEIFTSWEVVDKAWEECGLKIAFKDDPMEPFQKIEGEKKDDRT